MSAKHTPGPWAINYAGTGRDGKLIYDEVYVSAPGSGVDDIAIASDIADPLGGDSMPNALLISAAPDLLAALYAVLHDCDDLDMVESNEPGRSKGPWLMANEAINKATGGAT